MDMTTIEASQTKYPIFGMNASAPVARNTADPKAKIAPKAASQEATLYGPIFPDQRRQQKAA